MANKGIVPAITRSVERAFVIVAACAAAACGAREPLPLSAGVSEPRARSEARPSPDAGGPARWDREAEVAAYPRVNRVPFPSRGHFEGRWTADVAVSREAKEAYGTLAPATRLPVGSVVVEQLREIPSGRRGPWFVMQKREDGWRYVVVDAQGVVEDEGALAGCARCHAEAVSDSLFGIPPAGR